MSLRCLVRRQHGFVTNRYPSGLLRNTSLLYQSRQVRQAHAVPQIKDETEDEALRKEGVPGLFSKKAYDIAWTQYQQFMVDRLNTILADDEVRGQWPIKNLLIQTARDPNLASTFNYASMAHNNHFFFSTLSRTSTELPSQLERHLIASYGSMHALRDSFLSTAAGMFGPGFVWLVQEDRPSVKHPAHANAASLNTGVDQDQLHFRTVVTYLAGTPYPGAHTRQQGVDMNVQNLSSMEDFNRHSQIQNEAGSFGRHSRSARGMGGISSATTGHDDGGDTRRFGGADITPVLCVNTWQHAYMQDHGVAGKRNYLAKWWEKIDWDTVAKRCQQRQEYNYML